MKKTQRKVKLHSNSPFKGEYNIVKIKATFRWLPRKIWFWLYDHGFLNHRIISRTSYSNLIVANENNGLNLIFQALGGYTVYPIELDNASIGTGTTPPDADDTDLETPVVQNIVRARRTVGIDNIVTEWFLSNDELPNGTYNEFALKCGTQLFARSIISPAHTKGDLEDTLFEYTISATITP